MRFLRHIRARRVWQRGDSWEEVRRLSKDSSDSENMWAYLETTLNIFVKMRMYLLEEEEDL